MLPAAIKTNKNTRDRTDIAARPKQLLHQPDDEPPCLVPCGLERVVASEEWGTLSSGSPSVEQDMTLESTIAKFPKGNISTVKGPARSVVMLCLCSRAVGRASTRRPAYPGGTSHHSRAAP